MSEKNKFFVITAVSIKDTGTVNLGFMEKAGLSYRDIGNIPHVFGWLRVEKNKWKISVFNKEGGLGGIGHNDDLIALAQLGPSCILLMQDNLFGHFEDACKEGRISFDVHHFDGDLKTSYKKYDPEEDSENF